MPEKIVDTKINVNTTEAQKEIARLTKQLEKLDAQIEKKRAPKAGLYDFVAELEEQARKLDPKSGAFKELAEKIDTAWADLFDFEEGAGITGLLEDRDALTGAINELERASADVAQNTGEAKENTSELGKNAESSTGSFDKIANRLKKLALNALVFNQVARAMRSVVQYFGQALASNQEWNYAVAELRGALATLVQPLVNGLLPVLLTILRVITAIISHIASILSLIFGTTLGESAKQAQKIGSGMATGAKNAEKMKKALAGFDEINTLDTTTQGSGGGGGAVGGGGSSFDFAKGVQEDILAIEAVALSSMLALGLLLLFTGANIPLGLGLVVAGAMGLAGMIRETDFWTNWVAEFKQTIEDVKTNFNKFVATLKKWWADWRERFLEEWNNAKNNFKAGIEAIKQWWADWTARLKEEWTNFITNIRIGWYAFKTWIGNTINAIKTAFINGWNGIKTNVNNAWNSIKTTATNLWNSVKNGANGVRTALSNVATNISNVFSNAWNSLKNGAVTAWNSIKSTFSTVASHFGGVFSEAWEAVKSVFSTGGEIFGGIKETVDVAIKDVMNKVIGGFNAVVRAPINAINGVIGKIKYVKILGWHPFWDLGYLTAPQIPYLAQGGVVPPNREFLAMLGDNKTETEVVSPLSTMQEAMVNALQQAGIGNSQTIQVNVDGKKLFDIIVNQNNNTVKRTGATPLLV